MNTNNPPSSKTTAVITTAVTNVIIPVGTSTATTAVPIVVPTTATPLQTTYLNLLESNMGDFTIIAANDKKFTVMLPILAIRSEYFKATDRFNNTKCVKFDKSEKIVANTLKYIYTDILDSRTYTEDPIPDEEICEIIEWYDFARMIMMPTLQEKISSDIITRMLSVKRPFKNAINILESALELACENIVDDCIKTIAIVCKGGERETCYDRGTKNNAYKFCCRHDYRADKHTPVKTNGNNFCNTVDGSYDDDSFNYCCKHKYGFIQPEELEKLPAYILVKIMCKWREL